MLVVVNRYDVAIQLVFLSPMEAYAIRVREQFLALQVQQHKSYTQATIIIWSIEVKKYPNRHWYHLFFVQNQ